MTRFPMDFDEIWMTLDDQMKPQFCTEPDYLLMADLEADIEVVGDEWSIDAVRLKAVTKGVARYQELTGDILIAAKAHLRETCSDFIQERIEEEDFPETPQERQAIEDWKLQLEDVS